MNFIKVNKKFFNSENFFGDKKISIINENIFNDKFLFKTSFILNLVINNSNTLM